MNHAGSLAHAPDGHDPASHRKADRNLFRLCVRCHDGLCRCGCRLSCIGEEGDKSGYAGFYLINRKLLSDHTGGGDQNRVLRNRQDFRGRFCRLSAVFQSFFPCARVGDAAVNDNGLCFRAFVDNMLIPFHGGGLHQIGGKGACRDTRNLAADYCQIPGISFLNPRTASGCQESFWRCYAGISNLKLHFCRLLLTDFSVLLL